MTNKQALGYWRFKYICAKEHEDDHWKAEERHRHQLYVKALETAIVALEKAESTPEMDLRENKEPIPQYIKLDSIINDIKKECLSCRYKDADNCQDCTIDRRIHSIEQLCNSEPLYWETWAGNLLKCPACEHKYTDAVECTNFCGNCGTPLQFKKEE